MSSNAARGGYFAPTEKSDGSARFVISRGQLERLRSNKILWSYIARILGGRSTIHRRRKDIVPVSVHLCDGICYTYFLISINIEDNYTVITILGQTPPVFIHICRLGLIIFILHEVHFSHIE